MLRIYSDTTSFEFGEVTSISDTFSKQLVTTPIPSMPVQRAFSIELGARLEYTIDFVRKNPHDWDDTDLGSSERWCNATWLKRVLTLTERWQARTNGYRLSIMGSDLNAIGVPSFSIPERVFITSITYNYKAGFPDTLFGTMTLRVTGQLVSQNPLPTMDASLGNITLEIPNDYKPENTIISRDNDAYVMMSDSKVTNWYMLQTGTRSVSNTEDYFSSLAKKTDIVKDYTIHGGPSDPFEYVTLTLSRKAITQQCPELDGDIFNGCNQILISTMSREVLTLASVSSSSKEYKIKVYCNAEKIRSASLHNDLRVAGNDSGNPSIMRVIQTLLFDYASMNIASDPELFIYTCDMARLVPPFVIKKGTNVWVAIQLCAMILNARPFFANGKFYLIDYTRLAKNDETTGDCIPVYSKVFYEKFVLNPGNDSNDKMYGRVIGEPSSGDEGLDTVINDVKIYYGTGDTQYMTPSQSNTMSMSQYQYATKTYDSLDLSRYLKIPDKDDEDYDTTIDNCRTIAQIIAQYFIDYRAEPQTSIKFETRERVSSGAEETGWMYTFPVVCAVEEIEAPTIPATSTAYSLFDETPNGKKVIKPQKLFLSSYEHKYPDYSSEYTFGVIENIDLSQSTAKIEAKVGING